MAQRNAINEFMCDAADIGFVEPGVFNHVTNMLTDGHITLDKAKGLVQKFREFQNEVAKYLNDRDDMHKIQLDEPLFKHVVMMLMSGSISLDKAKTFIQRIYNKDRFAVKGLVERIAKLEEKSKKRKEVEGQSEGHSEGQQSEAPKKKKKKGKGKGKANL